MFKNNPKTQEVFEFAKGTDAAQMQNSSRLLFHVTRVMKNIGKVVENLDSLEDIVPMLRQLGGRHGTAGYNVPPEYFPVCNLLAMFCTNCDKIIFCVPWLKYKTCQIGFRCRWVVAEH